MVWNLGGNAKNAGNQGGDVQNQGGNDKYKEWREAKIIENEHTCKNLVLHI